MGSTVKLESPLALRQLANICLMVDEWQHIEALLADPAKAERVKLLGGYRYMRRYVDDSVCLEKAYWLLPSTGEYGLNYSEKELAPKVVFVGYEVESRQDSTTIHLSDKAEAIRTNIDRYPRVEVVPYSMYKGCIVGALHSARDASTRDNEWMYNVKLLLAPMIALRYGRSTIFHADDFFRTSNRFKKLKAANRGMF